MIEIEESTPEKKRQTTWSSFRFQKPPHLSRGFSEASCGSRSFVPMVVFFLFYHVLSVFYHVLDCFNLMLYLESIRNIKLKHQYIQYIFSSIPSISVYKWNNNGKQKSALETLRRPCPRAPQRFIGLLGLMDWIIFRSLLKKLAVKNQYEPIPGDAKRAVLEFPEVLGIRLVTGMVCSFQLSLFTFLFLFFFLFYFIIFWGQWFESTKTALSWKHSECEPIKNMTLWDCGQPQRPCCHHIYSHTSSPTIVDPCCFVVWLLMVQVFLMSTNNTEHVSTGIYSAHLASNMHLMELCSWGDVNPNG